jgi:hypothetical protein
VRIRSVAALVAVAVIGASVAVPALGPGDRSHTIVTGHVSFTDLAGLDPCLSAVAGLVTGDNIKWFDDSIFHQETFEGKYIYASEAQAGNPTAHVRFDDSGPLEQDAEEIEENVDEEPADKVLVRSGVWYNFTDPNHRYWNVTEVFWDQGARADPDGATNIVDADTDGASVSTEANASAQTNRHYAWIVEIGPTRPDGYPGGLSHDEYNFVNMVNTCKFSDEAERAARTQHDPGNRTDGETGPPGRRHADEAHQEKHHHEEWDVKLWLGDEPDTFNLDAEPVNEVTVDTVGDFANGGDAS